MLAFVGTRLPPNNKNAERRTSLRGSTSHALQCAWDAEIEKQTRGRELLPSYPNLFSLLVFLVDVVLVAAFGGKCENNAFLARRRANCLFYFTFAFLLSYETRPRQSESLNRGGRSKLIRCTTLGEDCRLRTRHTLYR